ncbi:MAG: peptidyl-prolyl cis-trans isomerase [Candidatus Omnitrophota bacterium]
MRKLKFIVLLSFLVCCGLLTAGQCRLIYGQDKIIAIVNNEIITQKDLGDFVNFTRMQYAKDYDYKGEELTKKIEELKPELLNKLIEDALILQEARKNNLNIDDSRVRGRIEEIKREYGSDARFQSALKAQGLVQADVESRLRNQLLTYNIIQLKVKSKVIVRPEEVTDFYNRNADEFSSPEERQLLAITLTDAGLAKTFAYHFKAGQKLEDLAARYPINVSKLNATREENLKKEIEKVVFSLGIGEISDPLDIDGKFYIFKLEHMIPARKLSLKEAQDKINAYLFEIKMQEAFDKWLKEIKEQSYIKIMQD